MGGVESFIANLDVNNEVSRGIVYIMATGTIKNIT